MATKNPSPSTIEESFSRTIGRALAEECAVLISETDDKNNEFYRAVHGPFFYVGMRKFSDEDRAKKYAAHLDGVVTPHENPEHKGFKVEGKGHKDHTSVTPALLQAMKQHNANKPMPLANDHWNKEHGLGDSKMRGIVRRAAAGKHGLLRNPSGVKVSAKDIADHLPSEHIQ